MYFDISFVSPKLKIMNIVNGIIAPYSVKQLTDAERKTLIFKREFNLLRDMRKKYGADHALTKAQASVVYACE